MTRNPVISSNLASVGYDVVSGTLEIQFHSGDIYDYSSVPLEIYNSLMSAPSKGHFFYEAIRKGGYAYVKVFDEKTQSGSPTGAEGLTAPGAAIVAVGTELFNPNAPVVPPTVSTEGLDLGGLSGLSELL